MSPSVTKSNSPAAGAGSLLTTGLPRARLTVPSGAKNGGRGLPSGFSTFGSFSGTGVPRNAGAGSSISMATIFTISVHAAGSRFASRSAALFGRIPSFAGRSSVARRRRRWLYGAVTVEPVSTPPRRSTRPQHESRRPASLQHR